MGVFVMIEGDRIVEKGEIHMIWDKGSSYGRLQPLTTEMIEMAEQQLHVKLPPAYLKLLSEQNGGTILHRAFPTMERNNWAEDHVHLDTIHGIAEDEGILQSAYLIQEWGLPEQIVLLGGDGHSWVAFDYRETNENPPIIYLEADEEILFELAPNFETFIEGLYTHIEENGEDESIDFSVNDAIQIFETEQKDMMIQAFNIFYYSREGNEALIEHWVITLLQHEDVDIRKWAGHYAIRFKELNVWTSEAEAIIINILTKDKDLQAELEVYNQTKVLEGMNDEFYR